ncbi:hypothetical protein BDD43_3280 [Mucilaginibacter gracilis]|uniref:Uncharacterized protein n=1 Tax=Mucilaginibacter gracilis TaxID=423350 RepID=A0A495J515_9SPHI|nr:hypothetical protein [Mucilaginibacter gracilis]RKR83079.1 hypothetical protein BDD43_3280 [Mucilaginibacter gracilis]
METPKKPAKKTSAKAAPIKGSEKAPAPKPKSKFIDDDDDDEFDTPIEELGAYEKFDDLDEEDDY